MAEKSEKKEEKAPKKGAEVDNLQDFLDIPHEITIVIGRTEMAIGDLLRMDHGSIVELNKSAGESFDVLANGKLIGHGDVTVVEDRFGVRITDLVEPRGSEY